MLSLAVMIGAKHLYIPFIIISLFSFYIFIYFVYREKEVHRKSFFLLNGDRRRAQERKKKIKKGEGKHFSSIKITF